MRSSFSVHAVVKQTTLLGIAMGLFGCGSHVVSAGSKPQKVEALDSTLWEGKPVNSFMAADKFFFSSSSSPDFFKCLKDSKIDQFIGGYNADNLNGTLIGNHLENAKSAGLSVSAFYSYNKASGVNDSAIDGFLDQIRGKDVKQVWLVLEQPIKVADLTHLYQRVCVDAGNQCGVYSNYGGMTRTGLQAADMAFLNHLPLWFADGSGVLDANRKLNDFYGWTVTSGRQIFLDDKLCGTSVDVSIFESKLLDAEVVAAGNDVKNQQQVASDRESSESVTTDK